MDSDSNKLEQPNLLNDNNFWGKIRSAYLEDTTTRDPALSREITFIRDAMTKYFDQKKDERYIIEDFLGVGGVGIVFKVKDLILHTNRAIKIARPIEGKEDLVQGLISEEISRLQEVNHPNIISIFDVGSIRSISGQSPFFTMTFLSGAINGRKYFSTQRTTTQLFKFIDGFLAGATHLHSINLVHLDLKPSNVFVGEDGFAIIGDLGGTRKIIGEMEEEITVTCTSNYAHPELLALTSVSTGGEDNRRRGKIPRKKLKYEFDRFAIGKSLNEIISKFESKNPTELTAYQKKYLQLQSARLLDGRTNPEERPLGLTENTLFRIKYGSLKEVCDDFDKLLGRVNLINEIPELTPTTESIIQISRGRRTRLTARLTRLLREPLVRRLATVSQLGLVRLVYPGATHTRFEHSLGTYSNAANYIRSLYYDPINPLFGQIMSKNDLLATLLAAILHDLGQYSHAHDLYDVEPVIFKHETLTSMLLKGTWVDYRKLTDSLRKIIIIDWNIDPERIVRILEADPSKLSLEIRDRILHTIISGPIDADKLDYLLRDSDNCQAVFGNGLDRSRLLSTLTIVYQRQGAHDEQYFALGIHEKGRAAAESVGFIRFQMFNAVYWHHTVRAAKSMLQRAAFEWIAPKRLDPSKHEKLKREFYDFVLQYKKVDKRKPDGQVQLFNLPSVNEITRIGHTSNPQWSSLYYTDLSFLQWLYERTSDTGKELIEAIAKRELYKRIFVISAIQSRPLWEKIQSELRNYDDFKRYSEELRKSIKIRVDEIIKNSSDESKSFFITGVGETIEPVQQAARILGGEGTVLIDAPKPRGKENLLFFPEDLHRGQREEFQAPSLLAVSESWQLFSNKLHETAGNIRIFVHPDVAILKSTKTKNGNRILDSSVIEEEIKTIFGAN